MWSLKQVDIVISTLAVPQYLEQLKIIKAIKDAGNIKRFIPSEFGNEQDRVTGLPPLEAIHANRRKIRRATEAAGIAYTYVSSNSFASYFVDYVLHPRETRDDVIVYGSGEAKAVLNCEEDVAAYTIRAASDRRAANRIVICRPQGNIVSQLDLISSWEKKTGRTLKRIHVPEQEIIQLSQSLPHPDNVRVSILHSIFIKGDQMSFELTDNDVEPSQLYPDYKYTCIDNYLDICLVDPPEVKLTTF